MPDALLAPVGEAGSRRVRCRVCRSVFAAPTSEVQSPAWSRRWRAVVRPAVVAGLAAGFVAGGVSALVLDPAGTARLAARADMPQPAAAVLLALADIPLPWTAGTPLRFAVSSRADALPDGGRVIEVSGEILNPTARTERIPALELRLVDRTGLTLERRPLRPGAAEIPPGGRLAFSTVALAPPPGATGAKVAIGGALLDRL